MSFQFEHGMYTLHAGQICLKHEKFLFWWFIVYNNMVCEHCGKRCLPIVIDGEFVKYYCPGCGAHYRRYGVRG